MQLMDEVLRVVKGPLSPAFMPGFVSSEAKLETDPELFGPLFRVFMRDCSFGL
jgi:hypothetical protein